jgi:hypothetical protein
VDEFCADGEILSVYVLCHFVVPFFVISFGIKNYTRWKCNQ